MQLRIASIATAAALVAVGLAGCAPADTPAASEGSGLSIVASTNVWGGIASSIAGDRASVTNLISNDTQDPHSYEASARDQLAISRADIVIENGGGYDSFMDLLLDGSSNADAVIINASDESALAPESGLAPESASTPEQGHSTGEPASEGSGADGNADEHAHVEGFNEHVWYSFEAVRNVAQQIADELSAIDPANAADYRANFAAFSAEIDGLVDYADVIKSEFAGAGAAITEPIPAYILDATGLVNLTPEEFSTAFEEGVEVSPIAMRDTIAIVERGMVSVFAYNDQTTSAQGEQVLDAATAAGIPVVSFRETLPDGHDYVSWMTENLTALSEALHS